MLSIAWGILARQRIFVCFVVATIAAIVGLGILLSLPHGPYPEPAAVSNLRTINTAQVTYLSSSGGTYGSMTDLVAAKLLDDTFTGTKAGYKYSITLDSTGSEYTAEAVPAPTNTGRDWSRQLSGCGGSLFNECFACPGRQVRAFRSGGTSSVELAHTRSPYSQCE